MDMNWYEKNKDKFCIKMPQYDVVNGHFIFMNFRYKQCDEELIKAFIQIEYKERVSEIIRKGIHIDILKKMCEEHYLILMEIEKTEKSKEKILIFSPHVDDAAFSLGGLIAKYNNKYEFIVVNVFSKQNYTLYWDKHIQSRIIHYQLAEEKVFWEIAQIKGIMLNYEDAPLRKEYRGKKYMGCLSENEIIQAEQYLFELLSEHLKKIIEQYNPKYFFCPIGTGKHVDHILVRESCIRLLSRFRNIVFYEDMPYSLIFESEYDSLVKRPELSDLKPISIDIKNYMFEKRKYISVYQSQLRRFQMRMIMDHRNTLENIWSFRQEIL